MSLAMMDKELIAFLRAHPEYFEGADDSRLIAHDLRSTVEAYALALDPSEYEALRAKVADFRAKEEARIHSEIAKLTEQMERERAIYDEVVKELAESEAKLKSMEQELQEVLVAVEGRGRGSGTGSGGKSYFYLILDFIGILFLYVGFILSDKPLVSYIVAGVFCILAGFILQQKGRADSRGGISVMAKIGNDMRARNDRSVAVWSIKKHTLNGRKKLALSSINECDRKIQEQLSRINGKDIK